MMPQQLALTVTTNQIQGWGIVGCLILAAITVLAIRLLRSMIGRVAWTVVVIALLALAWQQRGQITASVKRCDPQVLGLHLKISDPAEQAKCENAISSHP